MSPLVRHQAGANFARQLDGGRRPRHRRRRYLQRHCQREPLNSNRHDNITVFDLRVDKSFDLGHGVRVRGLFDLFNITNSNAAETRTITTGTAYLRPTAVLAPRTMRIGARVSF